MTMSTARTVNNSAASFHLEIFDLLCIFHRLKRVTTKEMASSPGSVTTDDLTEEQRGEHLNRLLYRVINEVEQRILMLPSTPEVSSAEYFDEWSFLTWVLLSTVNRLQNEGPVSLAYLDYCGKHFEEKIHAALVELVNKAQRMQPPMGVAADDQHYEQFCQAYVTTLLSLHELYTSATASVQGKWMYTGFEAQVERFREQLTICLQLQREFCISHGYFLWRQIRTSQIQKMTHYGHDNKGFTNTAVSFYSHMLYNLGVLAARLQGFRYEIRNNKAFDGKPDLITPLLEMVYSLADVLVGDSIVCIEPSQSAILVTNNLFPMKIVSLCRSVFFREFSLQVVSEEVAHQIQQEMRQRKTFDPPVAVRTSPSAALLAMKPATGVKRNNATASAEGGNTAHKKSDVNSKEWISIAPSYDVEHQGWVATYPHLLCTTRQKDALLDSRCTGQTGKRPLFYFHVRAEMFSFAGELSAVHTLSLPFAIATRRNQDCQVQRMMSSYTATCFWLYGTNVLDGLLLQWFDGEIEWKLFKTLYAHYFAMNAEVTRSLCDEDFNILRLKMHCAECSDQCANGGAFTARVPPLTVSFKNVLCPHLHYAANKADVKFSIWRGMLELLHLFSDQKTEIKALWESGLLLGFLESDRVHALLQNVESGVVMRLSFVIGCCVCFTVKTGGEILDLEPLELRRLQAKSLYEYMRDIIIAEKVDYVLNVNKEWLHVNEAMKLCQRPSSAHLSEYVTTRDITSNIMHAGPVDMQQTITFTALRVAVVACKTPASTNEQKVSHHVGQARSSPGHQNGDFEQKLEALMREYGRSKADVVELLTANATNEGQPMPLADSIMMRRQSTPAGVPLLPQRSQYLSTIQNGNVMEMAPVMVTTAGLPRRWTHMSGQLDEKFENNMPSTLIWDPSYSG